MSEEKEMTAPNVSIGVDTEQSSIKQTTNSISNRDVNFNPFDEFFKKIDPSYMKTVTMQELYQDIYSKKPPVIEGLLYQGTYLFVGSPKIGKSFFMAQLAYHVSTGTPLWDYPVKKGTVLYLALEDDYRRLQERMYRMFGTDSTENLYFSVSSKPLGNGLTDQLSGFIREHPDTTLVIIDTLQKVREVDSDSYSYAKDYEIINQLKQFSDSWGICLLLVHHTRKQKSSDNFDMISGTNGLLGCADGAFMLYKENRTSNKATLEISGRDQQDQKIHLIRDEEKLCWNFEKAETELWKEPPEPLLECIANHVTEENPTWQGTATELIEKLGLDMKPNVVSLKLNVNAGRLMNDYSIRYTNKRNHSGRMIFFSLLSKE
ncbi:AAA family ATPase [Ruminococcus sp. 210702-SL.1.03]|uniref:AAA family ATPase n=1 Tax=Ruminococcus sp. 210702-SL.1.03 TaxID=2883233 RepID=UPI001D09069E|nr:AAA family ATPase [Ruminococcus sp. 210702-SL.1.03]MCB6615710.1 helicase RepA family protein [Ruminococcus sp. 210702-SL.1.03]